MEGKESKGKNVMLGIRLETKKRFKGHKVNNETDNSLLNRLIDSFEKGAHKPAPQAGGKNAGDNCQV